MTITQEDFRGGHADNITISANHFLGKADAKYLKVNRTGSIANSLILPDARQYGHGGGPIFIVENTDASTSLVIRSSISEGVSWSQLEEVIAGNFARCYVTDPTIFNGWTVISVSSASMLVGYDDYGNADGRTKFTSQDLTAYDGNYVRLDGEWDTSWLVTANVEAGAKEDITITSETPVNGYATVELCRRGWMFLFLVNQDASMSGSSNSGWGTSGDDTDFRMAGNTAKAIIREWTGNAFIQTSSSRTCHADVKFQLGLIGKNSGPVENYDELFAFTNTWPALPSLNLYDEIQDMDIRGSASSSGWEYFLSRAKTEFDAEDDGDKFVIQRSIVVYCTDHGITDHTDMTNQVSAAQLLSDRMRFVVCPVHIDAPGHESDIAEWVTEIANAGYDSSLAYADGPVMSVALWDGQQATNTSGDTHIDTWLASLNWPEAYSPGPIAYDPEP